MPSGVPDFVKKLGRAPLLLPRFLNWLGMRGKGFFAWAGRDLVVGTTIATLLALTINDFVSISGGIRSGVESARNVFRSEAAKGFDELYGNQGTSRGFWAFEPRLSEAGKEFLVDNWSDSRPDRLHFLPRRAGKEVEPTDLYLNASDDGRWFRVFGYVDQVYEFEDAQENGVVRYSFRLSLAGHTHFTWCIAGVPEGAHLGIGQPIEVIGAVVGRGAAHTGDGGFSSGTLLLCSTLRPRAPAAAAEAVADVFNSQRENAFWQSTPELAGQRLFFMRNWRKLNPWRLHAYNERGAREVSFERLWEDSALDGKLVRLDAFVTDARVESLPRGRVTQFFEIGVRGEALRAWCYTTRPRSARLDEGDHVRVVGAVVARGSASSSGGGFENTTLMICPSVYRWHGAQ